MAIHETVEGYRTGARDYVAGRPGYPPETLAWLREVLGVGPGRTVLEVGAGTGKFLPTLTRSGGRVIALEPIEEMREQLAQAYPEVEALAGTAEAIPLADGSVDAVICAQSFHWFANPAALQEMRRVLAPDGALGLIWNVRDESVPWVAELSEITNRWEGNAPRYHRGDWRHVFPAPGFAFLDERHVRNGHVGTPEQVVVKRTLSVSFIAALPADQRAEAEREVRALIARTPKLAQAGEIAFPYETSMFAYRKV